MRYQLNKNLSVKLNGDKYVIVCDTGYQYIIGKKEYEIICFFNEQRTIEDLYRNFRKYDHQALNKIVDYFVDKKIIVRYSIKSRWSLEKLNHLNKDFSFERHKELRLSIIVLLLFSLFSFYKYRSQMGVLIRSLNRISIKSVVFLVFAVMLAEVTHEIGHILFAIMNNCQLEYIGFKRRKVMINMYTSIINTMSNSKKQEISFYFGGTASNFISAGAILQLREVLHIRNLDFLLFLSVVNYVFSIMNLLPSYESDGFQILQIIRKNREGMREI